ncbi:MAG TPA: thermonuclease family protein [Thermomicrobiales bacterium]|nr:thermonuclease family protein [Thermomicrobiales bacterium]
MVARSLAIHPIWILAALALLAASLASPAAGQTPTVPVDEPSFETHGSLPWEEPPGATPFVVEEVVDGDTIRVIEDADRNGPDPWWELVRIIGIDTPETESPYTEEECYGEEASEFLSELLPQGTTVYLQVDNDPDIPDDREITDEGMELDDYDRWLAHAYLRDGEDYYLLSEVIVLGGYAEVPGYEGNTYFVKELDEAEEIAREENRGMWGACDA